MPSHSLAWQAVKLALTKFDASSPVSIDALQHHTKAILGEITSTVPFVGHAQGRVCTIEGQLLNLMRASPDLADKR